MLDIALTSPPREVDLAALAGMLAQSLPTGSCVVVCWDDERLGKGSSEVEGVPGQLRTHAAALMAGKPATGGSRGAMIDECWNEGEARVAIAARLPEPLTPSSRDAWRALARRLVSATIASAQAEARIESLRKSERLQQSLYEIADLAGSGLEMAEVLKRIHGIVGGLMSAANFYIVLYDDVRDTMRFLYFADRLDPWRADASIETPIATMPNSLTVALLRHGHPLRGATELIRKQLAVDLDLAHGPDAADWLGVPMRREGRVSGAIVVQSYDQPDCYTDEDRALLEFVAQHILTALDRKHAQAELERRVHARTRELQQANQVLQAEIIERQRAERLQRALFRISELSFTAESMEGFYGDLHAVVGELLYARNFYIAMVSGDGGQIEFPYSVDERDIVRRPRRMIHGLSEYVINSGRALLADREVITRLESSGELRHHGTLAHCWLGVPLLRDGIAVGVIAVQSYSRDIDFTVQDQKLLTFVAHHIGGALARKRSQDHLKAAHAELEHRVDARTRELEDTNRELRAQVSERMRAEERLIHQARHDHLTGLPNRIHLLDRLDAAIAETRRQARGPFAVLFLDLDRFKLVNDSVGHAAGDEMLVEVGRRIARVLREGDVVARLGGDEFAVMLGHAGDDVAAQAVAARILAELGRPMWVAGRELFPSASVGIAMWQPRYQHGEDLLRDADAAMYRAKARGRDRSELFDEEMRAEATRLLDLEADLRRAILADAFEPWFQPIIDLATGRVVGHEALLRWNHEVHGALSPGDFIGVGEDSGLIEQVDWLVYRRAFAWMARHREGYVSINVSPRHFHSDNFAERLLQMLEDSGAEPSRLRIEITEVALLDDAPRALRMLETLRARGILALLDDFGTGFSALSYLHRFPIHALKIDQSFVAGLDDARHPESLALVRAILALASTLGIDTIGEGVETEGQAAVLRQLGCTMGQGFLFGHPKPAAAAESRGAA
ncbi:EAL domain-containing protein [Luteimonas sp. MJ250]|uniref:bifunctional diguanylate cyclase/phosphodiesterase n=1 Tax=Luteimonas sp. MJ250 TaxID=3129236 RepID=UPI0031BBC1FC